MSFVLVETETGHETEIIEHESTFSYYIFEGSGYFQVEDEREDCAVNVLVIILPGKRFAYKGRLKMLLVCTPPWREEQEETID